MSKKNPSTKDGKSIPPGKEEEMTSANPEDAFLKFQTDLDSSMNAFNDDSTKLEIVESVMKILSTLEDIPTTETPDK